MTPKRQSGFSLIEVLIALAVLIIVMGGLTSMAVGVIKTSRISKEELEAYGQAQEQIELVRQIRNTNLIDGKKNTEWDSNLWCSNPCHIRRQNNQKWKLRGGSSDWSSSATNQTYQKYLTIYRGPYGPYRVDVSDQYIMKVTSVVKWEDRTGPREVRLITYLTDWLWGYGD